MVCRRLGRFIFVVKLLLQGCENNVTPDVSALLLEHDYFEPACPVYFSSLFSRILIEVELNLSWGAGKKWFLFWAVLLSIIYSSISLPPRRGRLMITLEKYPGQKSTKKKEKEHLIDTPRIVLCLKVFLAIFCLALFFPKYIFPSSVGRRLWLHELICLYKWLNI